MIADLLSLVRFNLFLKRGYLTAWLLPTLFVVAIFPPIYSDYYPTLESRQEILSSLGSNAGVIALFGNISWPGYVGQMTAWEMGMWGMVLGSVMTVLMTLSLHRAGESTGLIELQRSTGIRSIVPALAAAISAGIGALLLGGGVTLILLVEQFFIDELYTEGALALGVTIALASAASALIAQLVVMLFGSEETLTVTGLLTVAVLFMARVWADLRDVAWLNWLSPLGWRAKIQPFTEDDWSAALIGFTIVLVLLGAVGVLESRRSHGSALLPVPRPAPRPAQKGMGVLALRGRLALPALSGWIVAVGVLSAFLMSMSGTIQELAAAPGASAEVFRDVLGGSVAYELFIAYIAQAIAILISAAGVGLVSTYRQAEESGTVDLLRSTGMRRWVPLASVVLIGAGAVAVLIATLHAAGSLGLWSQESTTGEDYVTIGWAAWSQLGPTWLFVGITSFVMGVRPTWSVAGWLVLGAAAFIALLGDLLGLPQWLIDSSPFTHSMTSSDSDPGPILLMVGLGILLAVGGIVASSRRDLR